MKSLTLFTLFFITLFVSKSQNLEIIRSSFDTAANVRSGSTQWIDAKYKIGGTGLTHVSLYIWNNPNQANVNKFNSITALQFNSLPLNDDGLSRRIYFTMPSTVSPGSFSVNINLYLSHADGVLLPETTIPPVTPPVTPPVDPPVTPPVTTSITLPQAISQGHNIKYFSLEGLEIELPEYGFFIWRSDLGASGKCFRQ